MRLVAWNILHGGGPARVPEIILSLVAHRPDVVLLSEFRAARGSQLRAALADHGLEHQCVAAAPERVNGLLLASRTPLRCLGVEGSPGRGRWIGAEMIEEGVMLGCVHAPDEPGPERKSYWQFLTRVGREWSGRKALFWGDFNACRGELDGRGRGCAAMLGRFVSAGYSDAWRVQNPSACVHTWYGHDGKGWRIDGAYVTESLRGMLQRAWHSQVERERGESDHALVMLDLQGFEGRRPVSAARGGLFGLGAEG